MELWQGLMLGLIAVAVIIFVDMRRTKSYSDYLKRKRGK